MWQEVSVWLDRERRHRTDVEKGQNQDSNAYLVLAKFLMLFSNCQIKPVKGSSFQEETDSGQETKSNCHMSQRGPSILVRREYCDLKPSLLSAGHAVCGYCSLIIVVCRKWERKKKMLHFSLEDDLGSM